jgi:hypothetical protein
MHKNRRLSPTLTATVLAFAALSACRASLAAEPDASAPQGPPTAQLQRLVPKTTIGSPEPTAINGIFRVKIGSAYVYLTADGRHAFTGDLLDLTTGANLTEQQRNKDHLQTSRNRAENGQNIGHCSPGLPDTVERLFR